MHDYVYCFFFYHFSAGYCNEKVCCAIYLSTSFSIPVCFVVVVVVVVVVFFFLHFLLFHIKKGK